MLALLFQAGVSALLGKFIQDMPLQSIVSILTGSAIFAIVLDTTFVKGLIVSVVFVVIAIAFAMLFGGMLGLQISAGT